MSAAVDGPSDHRDAYAVYVAGDHVNLRTGPTTDAVVAARLPLGAEVEIVRVGPEAVIDGRSDRRYAVRVDGREGFVWGGALTPARLELDLDGDPSAELATLAFAADHHPVLRVSDPDLPEAARVRFLDLPPAPGARATLDAWTARTEGLDLLEVTVGGAHTLVAAPAAGAPLAAVARWETAESEAGHRWVDVAYDPATRTLVEVARTGGTAADGSVSEEVRVARATWTGSAFAPQGVPSVRRVTRGPPVAVDRPLRVSAGEPTPDASADLDGDGAPEAISFAWRDHALTVRVAGKAGSGEHTFPARERMSGVGFVEAWRVGWSAEAGLLAVEDPGEEMCGSGSIGWFLTWSGGQLREALRTTHWADAPAFSYDEVTFHPRERVAVVTHHRGEDVDEEVTHRVLVLRDGVYAAEVP